MMIKNNFNNNPKKKTFNIPKFNFGTSLLFVLLLSASCTTKREWKAKLNYIDFDNSRVTQLCVNDEEKTVVVCNSKGISKFDANGKLLWQNKTDGMFLKKRLQKLANKNEPREIKTGSRKVDMPKVMFVRNVVYMKTHNDDFLEFNFDKLLKQTIRFIDGKSGSIVWEINDIIFSKSEILSYLRKTSTEVKPSVPPGKLFEKIFERNVICLPEKNQMLINANSGLYCIDMETGKEIWHNASFSKVITASLNLYSNSIAGLNYYKEGDALLVANYSMDFKKDDELAEKVMSIINPKGSISRIDMNTGKEVWKAPFANRLMYKYYDFSQLEIDKYIDMRVIKGVVLLNTLNIELYDFESGKYLSSTKALPENLAKALDILSPDLPFLNRDVPPIEDGDIIYYVANQYGINGIMPNTTQWIEAFSTSTKEIIWQSDSFKNGDFVKINNFQIVNDQIVISFQDKTGVAAFDKKTGKKQWSYEVGKRGITAPILMHDGVVYAAEWRKIHVINLQTGAVMASVNSRKAAGTVRDMLPHGSNLVVIGNKISSKEIKKSKGVGFYTLDDYSLTSKIKINRHADITYKNDMWYIMPLYPAERLVVVNDVDKKRVAKMKKSKYRNTITVSTDKDNKPVFYSVKNTPAHKKSRIYKHKIKK